MGGVPDKKHLVLEQTSVHKRLLANVHEDKEQLCWSNVLWTQSCFAQFERTCFVQTKESFSGEPQSSLEAWWSKCGLGLLHCLGPASSHRFNNKYCII